MDLSKESNVKIFENKNRKTIVKHTQKFEQLQRDCVTQREAANEIGIARSTLRHWVKRKAKNPLPQLLWHVLKALKV